MFGKFRKIAGIFDISSENFSLQFFVVVVVYLFIYLYIYLFFFFFFRLVFDLFCFNLFISFYK